MDNLFDNLRRSGFSEEEAEKSIMIVYKWVEERFPVLAAVARSTVLKDCNIELESSKETF